MPFTGKPPSSNPRGGKFVAPTAMYYTTSEGREVLDGTAGLWCCNAGHKRPRIVEAVQAQSGRARLCAGVPDGPSERPSNSPNRLIGHGRPITLAHVFYNNSGSESVETSLKLALAYAQGEGRRRAHSVSIGRERGLSRGEIRGISVGRDRQQPQGLRVASVGRGPLCPNTHSAALRRPSTPASPTMPRIWRMNWSGIVAAARPRDHCRRDRGARGGLRRAAFLPPKGLIWRRLRELCTQARHPADLERGHHRLRAGWAAPSPRTISDGEPDHHGHRSKGLTNGVIPMGRRPGDARRIHESPLLCTGRRNLIELFPRLHLFPVKSDTHRRRRPQHTHTETTARRASSEARARRNWPPTGEDMAPRPARLPGNGDRQPQHRPHAARSSFSPSRASPRAAPSRPSSTPTTAAC